MTTQTSLRVTATSHRSVQPAILEEAGCFGCGSHEGPRVWHKHPTYAAYIVLCPTCQGEFQPTLLKTGYAIVAA